MQEVEKKSHEIEINYAFPLQSLLFQVCVCLYGRAIVSYPLWTVCCGYIGKYSCSAHSLPNVWLLLIAAKFPHWTLIIEQSLRQYLQLMWMQKQLIRILQSVEKREDYIKEKSFICHRINLLPCRLMRRIMGNFWNFKKYHEMSTFR